MKRADSRISELEEERRRLETANEESANENFRLVELQSEFGMKIGVLSGQIQELQEEKRILIEEKEEQDKHNRRLQAKLQVSFDEIYYLVFNPESAAWRTFIFIVRKIKKWHAESRDSRKCILHSLHFRLPRFWALQYRKNESAMEKNENFLKKNKYMKF